MDCITKELNVDGIQVLSRIRKDVGGVEELAEDIEKRGLINPITVMDCGDGKYQLIAGLRRMEAYKCLGRTEIRASIFSPLDAEEQLRMEYAENVQRKNFITAERLEYADKIKAVEKAKANERKSIYARVGRHIDDVDFQDTDKRPYPEKGESRKAIAQKAGFSSYKQYERAEAISNKRPDLLEKIDAGETTIYSAYKQVMKDKKIDPIGEAQTAEKRSSTDQVVRAGHERLMKNPLYVQLCKDKQDAITDANRARAELDRKATFFANQVKHFTSNIEALKRQCDELVSENADLRDQLKNTPEVNNEYK